MWKCWMQHCKTKFKQTLAEVQAQGKDQKSEQSEKGKDEGEGEKNLDP